jgi:hypothetical protein
LIDKFFALFPAYPYKLTTDSKQNEIIEKPEVASHEVIIITSVDKMQARSGSPSLS